MKIKITTLKNFIVLALILSQCIVAQEKKYQSLLWEVSGNGLKKNSYLYGTMHVSNKVSYHLSDAFFKNLLASDMVANESEPRTWTELYDLFSAFYVQNNTTPFYNNFYLFPVEKTQLYPLFKSSNYNLESLLTRTNEWQKEYQEDTYLDMFIYRTGRKYNKQTVGLEDVKTTTYNIAKAEANINRKEVEKNRQAILKILKDKSYEQALVDFYREKDLDMIDSLTLLSSPKDYLKEMLYNRNVIMAKSIDSLAKKGSLFSAIGAAHLPGKNGVIEILREKGYIVKPIFDDYTQIGKSKKLEIENYFVKPELSIKSTADQMISLPLFDVVIENKENLESADLVNGGYINVKRLPLNNFLSKKNKEFNISSLDSLFYENIPGQILDKKSYAENNYWVYDIKNKTKTGKDQRYKYYITPLEIIAVIMGGEYDYVRKYEDLVYNNIKIKPYKDSWEKVVSNHNNFQISVPSYYIYSGNKQKPNIENAMKLSAFNQEKNAYYFLIQQTLANSYELEETDYELKRIPYEFLMQNNSDTISTHFNKDKTKLYTKAILNEKPITLQTIIKGSQYYLLGTINASDEDSNTFFNSLEFISETKNAYNYKTFTDESLPINIDVPKDLNDHLDYLFDKNNYYDEKDKNHFEIKEKNYTIYGNTGETIRLNYYTYHKYEYVKNIDSIWKNVRKSLINDYDIVSNFEHSADSTAIALTDIENSINSNDEESKKDEILRSNFYEKLHTKPFSREKNIITNEKTSYNAKTQSYIYEAFVTKEKSEQAIKQKIIINNGNVYDICALVPKNYKNDNNFIERTFQSVKIKDSTHSINIFNRKFDIFLEDINSEHDSIRSSALKSLDYLKLQQEDLQKYINLLENFSFKDDELEYKAKLYEKAAELFNKDLISFLEKTYKKTSQSADVQFAIIIALAKQKSEIAYQKIIALLDYDLPMSDDEYDITTMFTNFSDNLQYSQNLFPSIFQYYSIPEYHKPIINFTHTLLDENKANAKKLKSFKKMILTNAKLEYKRLASWKTKKDSGYEDYYYNNSENLISYINLLYPFKNDKDVNAFINKSLQLNINEVNTHWALLQSVKSKQLNDETAKVLKENLQTQFAAYLIYEHFKQNAKLEKLNTEDVAKAAVTYFFDIDTTKETLELHQVKTKNFKNKTILYYFFIRTNNNEESYKYMQQQLTGVAFIAENNKPNLKSHYRIYNYNFVNDDEIEDLMQSAIDESLNYGRTRTTNVKQKKSNRFNYTDY